MSPLKPRSTNPLLHQSRTRFLPRAKAGQYTEKMFVTFREPQKVSRTVLLPGTYVFQLLEPRADRNLVKIFNEDQTKLVATLVSVPDR